MFIEIILFVFVVYIYGGDLRIVFVNDIINFKVLILRNNKEVCLKWDIDR